MIQRLLRAWWNKKNEDGYVTKRNIQRAFYHQRYYKQKSTPDRIVTYEKLIIQVFKFLEENWEVIPQINRFTPALYRPKSWNKITGVLSKQELRKMKENEQVRESFGLSKVMVGKILRNHYTRKQIMKKNPHFKEGYLPLGFYKKNRVRQIKVTGKGRGGMITLFYAPDVDKYKQGKSETLSGKQRKQKKEKVQTYTYKKQGKDMYEQYKKLLEDGPFKKETKGDDVNHPDYYNDGKFEVIDVIEDWNLDFNAGNVIKYIARAKLKHTSKAEQKKDLKKALWYVQRMLDKL